MGRHEVMLIWSGAFASEPRVVAYRSTRGSLRACNRRAQKRNELRPQGYAANRQTVLAGASIRIKNRSVLSTASPGIVRPGVAERGACCAAAPAAVSSKSERKRGIEKFGACRAGRPFDNTPPILQVDSTEVRGRIRRRLSESLSQLCGDPPPMRSRSRSRGGGAETFVQRGRAAGRTLPGKIAGCGLNEFVKKVTIGPRSGRVDS